MTDPFLGTVIAERTLESGDRTVRVSIGMPRLYDTGPSYFCPIEIIGPITNTRKRAGGVDPVQALYLALQLIGTDLLFTPERKAGQLSWLGQMDLGFPLPGTVEGLRNAIPETP